MNWYDGKAENGLLWYPRSEDTPDTITVELADVRAADNLIIGYDFDRDGYTIARESEPEVESAFVRSWAESEVQQKADERALAYREVAASMELFDKIKWTFPARRTDEEDKLWALWGGSFEGFRKWLLTSANQIEKDGADGG